MKKLMIGLFVACFAAGLAVVGCGDSSDSDSKARTGILNLALTDAPVDEAEAVWVTFTTVFLQGVSGAADQGPFDVPEDKQTVNLMDYTGTDSTVVISDLQVPAGSYKLKLDADLTFTETEQASWIEFSATSLQCAELLELQNGAVWVGVEGESNCKYPLEIPSNEKFMPKGDITVKPGGTASFTVEFDLRKNIVDPQNNAIEYKLKPTGLRLIADAEAGSIAGSVSADYFSGNGKNACAPEDARVYLYDRSGGGDFVPEDMSNANTDLVTSVAVQTVQDGELVAYSYEIGFVPEGVYGLALTCDPNDDPEVDDAEFPFEAQVDSVNVVAGEQTVQDIN